MEALPKTADPKLKSFASGTKLKARKDYFQYYEKVGETWRCNTCFYVYTSDHGIRYHLNVTQCGFGTLTTLESKLRQKKEL